MKFLLEHFFEFEGWNGDNMFEDLESAIDVAQKETKLGFKVRIVLVIWE